MRLIRVSFLAVAVLAASFASAADDRSPVGEPALRLSTSLATVPVEPLETATSSASSPTFTERTRQPVEVLRKASEQSERELLDALTAARRHQQDAADLERRLAQARAQHYANPVVYVLAALLALAIIGATVFWRRLRSMDGARAIPPVDGGQPSA